LIFWTYMADMKTFLLPAIILHTTCLAQADTVYSILKPELDYKIIVEEKLSAYFGTTDAFSLGAMYTGRIIRDLRLIPVSPYSLNLQDTAQQIHIKIDIAISDRETGVPTPGTKVFITRDDGITKIFSTDQRGRIELDDITNPDFVSVGYIYTLEVEGKLEQYLGTTDQFTTKGIKTSTRIIRDLKVQTIYCHRWIPTIVFAENSIKLDAAAHSEIESIFDWLTGNPTIVLEVAGIYDNDKEFPVAQERSMVVYQKLIEMGIIKDRLILRNWARPLAGADDRTYPENYPKPLQTDVLFSILSFDYVPQY
jgi:hypothetical protein